MPVHRSQTLKTSFLPYKISRTQELPGASPNPMPINGAPSNLNPGDGRMKDFLFIFCIKKIHTALIKQYLHARSITPYFLGEKLIVIHTALN